MRKLLIMIVCAGLIFSVTGCGEKAVYSFDDPDICAYVNGEPVYESKMSQYIDMGKLYWQAEKESLLAQGIGGPPPEDEVEEAYLVLDEHELDLANEYCGMDDAQWKKDYYKTLLVKKVFYQSSGFGEDYISSTIEQYISDIRQSNEIVLANGALDAAALIQPVAQKYDLSDEECLDTVLRDFLTRNTERGLLMFSFPGYKGKRVEFDGENAQEYIEGVKDVVAQYNTYLDTLMEKAEFVERP